MKNSIQTVLVAAILASIAGTAAAAGADKPARASSVNTPSYMLSTEPLTPQQRGEIARDFVKKWGNYFQDAYQQPLGRWAQKQAVVIAKADSANLRNAMTKTTLEAAMMAMRGQNLSDDSAISFMAARSPDVQGALGDLAADLVYTPLPAPCRIFDTRAAGGGGVISSGGTRSFDTYPYGSNVDFAYQGGTASGNCGMIPSAAAVMINVAAPLPESPGFLTIYPYGTTKPLASNLDYPAGGLSNNEIVAKSANSTWDVTVYAHGKTNIAVDIIGYFAAPLATKLQCEDKSYDVVVANGVRDFGNTTVCSAGYSAVSGGVRASANDGQWINALHPNTPTESFFYSIQNASGASRTYTVTTHCCRVPGR